MVSFSKALLHEVGQLVSHNYNMKSDMV